MMCYDLFLILDTAADEGWEVDQSEVDDHVESCSACSEVM